MKWQKLTNSYKPVTGRLGGVVITACLLFAGLTALSGLPKVLAQDFSAGYQAETSLPTGMIVSVVPETDLRVEPSNRGNIERMLGVVVSGSGSLFNITSSESNVQVVTSGLTEVLVTDINGTITAGDYITVSNINGVGMKAGRDHSKILGTARADFDNPTVQTVQTEDGDSREVALARIPVVIQVGGNPDLASQDSFLPGFIQESANTVAGRQVAPARIIMALVIVTGGIVGSTVLLHGAVSSTIISIGRNPMSDKSIYAGLLRMVLIAIAIILLSCAIAYVLMVAG